MALGARPKARLGCPRESPKNEKYWKWKKGGLRLQPQAFYFHFQYFSILGLSRGFLNLAVGLASRAMDPGTEFFRKYKFWFWVAKVLVAYARDTFGAGCSTLYGAGAWLGAM